MTLNDHVFFVALAPRPDQRSGSTNPGTALETCMHIKLIKCLYVTNTTRQLKTVPGFHFLFWLRTKRKSADLLRKPFVGILRSACRLHIFCISPTVKFRKQRSDVAVFSHRRESRRVVSFGGSTLSGSYSWKRVSYLGRPKLFTGHLTGCGDADLHTSASSASLGHLLCLLLFSTVINNIARPWQDNHPSSCSSSDFFLLRAEQSRTMIGLMIKTPCCTWA